MSDLSILIQTTLIAVISVLSCANTPAAADARREPEVVFRFAVQPNLGNKVTEASRLLKEYLERESDGRIRVEYYHSAVLGAEHQILEACYFGVVEMVQVTSSIVTTIDPTFSLLDMPYLFVNEEHHQAILQGTIGQELLDSLRKHGLQGLGFYSCGFRHLFNAAGRQIRKPIDLQGLKIRVMESPVMLQSINAMGGNATPIPASEVFQALRTGVVDGAENNENVFISQKFYEAGCKNFAFTRHFANQHMLIANLEWFERLGSEHPDLQELVRNAPKAIQAEYNRLWDIAVNEAIDDMGRFGITVNDIADVQPFVDAVRPVYDDFLSRNPAVSRELVTRIRKEAGL